VVGNLTSGDKGDFEHFMLKEIFDGPEALRQTLSGKIQDNKIVFRELNYEVKNVNKIFIAGCGTAYHAGLVGRKSIEELAGIPVEIDLASEFAYRKVLWQAGDLLIVISQSGETADTLAALHKAKEAGIPVLAIVNVPDSTIARLADMVIYTQAGPEISIASTKVYVTQLLVLYLLALYLAQEKDTLPAEELNTYINAITAIDQQVEKALTQQPIIKEIASRYHGANNAFFLGRGYDYPVAMEGALKLKETSYIHAEAYATGELKHGPIALLNGNVLVMALVSQDALVEKTMPNINEIKSRGATIIVICKESLQQHCLEYENSIVIPDTESLLAPLVAVIPLQLFAYYMAVFRGTEVDNPRHLTKAVTVE
jgi:glucosamine--fructose-6-phosphate aminotransferase (isomerizing)